ncbi:MAG: hypothetical protein EOM34_11430 [Clostridia bacterium]|nr:hypothetical protein [Clostridia bacterium]NCD02848.1 hypothetical protein [Clostridia bacterium]
MENKKIFDLVQAMGEESVDTVLSEVLPNVVQTYGEVVVPEVVATVAGELVGAICPRLNNIRLSYKQNRLERNVDIMIRQLVENNQRLSERISVLESSVEGRKLLSNAGEMMLDNIVDEIQPEKVTYSVNGYINLLNTENANFDMALSFFKTLAELNDIDIRVLKNYDWKHPVEEPITPFNSEYDNAQLRFIKEKMVRLGLLRSKNQELFDKNQESVVDYLEKSYKDSSSRKPKGVKIPKFKKIASSDSFKMTTLGYSLLELISEQCDMNNLSIPDEESVIEE